MRFDFDTKPNQVVLYMDMLGFRNVICEDDDGTEKLNEIKMNFQALEKNICEMFGDDDSVKFLWMSDSFMLSTDILHINDLLWYMFEIQRDMLLAALPIRGAIYIGNLHHEKNIWGEALVHAVEIEETKSVYPRVLIRDEDFARLTISEEYAPYFKSDAETPGYRYVEPISCFFDNCLKNAMVNSNGIWAVMNVLISDIEDQYRKYCSNVSVRDKWKWIANVCMSVFQNNEELIRKALEIDRAANMQIQTFEECMNRLNAIVRWHGHSNLVQT